MSFGGQKRGPVGLAAEALKEALVAKLQPGLKDSPINDGIYQAIKLVEAFLLSYKESEADLEALKSQIKRLMLSQARKLWEHIAKNAPAKAQEGGSGPPSASGLPSDRRSKSACVGGRPPPPQQPHQPQPGAPGGARKDLQEAASTSTAHTGVPLYSRNSSRSTGSSSLDWTLPQRTLNRKAYVRNGDFGRMTLVQDELARKAEAAQQLEEAERKKATLAMVQEQMEIVAKKKEEEREARRRAQLEMDEMVRQHQTRKRQEVEQRMLEHEVERLQLLEEERREREKAEQIARVNAAQRDQIKRALFAAMEEKAAAKAAAVEEEMRYNREYIKKMEADEAARRQAVAKRQEKMRQAFERGGGDALQASLEEQERVEAARAARLAAELEAKTLERERLDQERRKKMAEAAMRELDEQVAAREAERRAAAAEEERGRREQRRAEAEARRQREEEKAARRRAQSEAREAQKAALAEEHRRRYHEYREPFEDRYRWLHAGVLSGTQRAFNNLAVPEGKAAVLASLEL
ncbi:hypothetical protein VOLCADRAFT_98749 [Volvox carteri f. nagariensis]|uniref:Trichohyalin-plectin-homology domain-containing protein n=1 Tax=Volvox carteri f. nagariensis TaxID=3068 RepID=D8UG69_VOLCA|nr:uncharacterized protein VOLCADRAFT_98749 [Volvox carteri f. nagariensis]EFJ41297.1 hypothetical protein VOLCADRAFT_98749 [Volvox carteri f. nagariensis]|eukprot:XP_002957631.1 hypothetical protein VOLCADRAFT_98749 [Volvox carteri f. nagariensis]